MTTKKKQGALRAALLERDSLADAARRLGELPRLGREVFTSAAARQRPQKKSQKPSEKKP